MLANLSIDPKKCFQVIPSHKSNTFLLIKKLNIRNSNLIQKYTSFLSCDKSKTSDLQNVIPIVDYSIEENNIYLISESVSCQSLSDFLKKEPDLSEMQSLNIIQNIINGIEQIRQRNIDSIHGNLNKNSIFVLSDIENHLLCKVTDFHKIIKITGNFQNSFSIAPELLEKKSCFLSDNFNIEFEQNYPKSDVWSIGWLFYELLSKKELWDYTDLKKMVDFLTNDDNSSFFKHITGISELSLDFLKKSLAYHPDNRMSWAELVAHPIFENIAIDEKVEIIKFDLSQLELNINKEENYAKFKFEIKGIEENIFPDELVIKGYSNEFNLINLTYDFEFLDAFTIFSEPKSFLPYEGKVWFKFFDKINQKNFTLRIFKVDLEKKDFLPFLKDCCFEHVISKIQRKIGLNILNLYEIFVNFYDTIDMSKNYVILVYDDFEFFFQDLLENLFEDSFEINLSQKLYVFLLICKEVNKLKQVKFNKIQALQPQNIAFTLSKITNKISIKLAFFNDVNSFKTVIDYPENQSTLSDKAFEQKWKSVTYYLGTFFYQIIAQKKFFNENKAISILQELKLDKNLITLCESMLLENLDKRITIEELIYELQQNDIQENDLEFLRPMVKYKIDEKIIKDNIPSTYEILFHFNKAIKAYENLLQFEKQSDEILEMKCNIAQNYLFLMDFDKCNSTCYNALKILKTEKVKSDKVKCQVLNFKLNLMNGISLMSLGLPEKSINYLEAALQLGEKIRVFNPFAQPSAIKFLCDNNKALGKNSKALNLNEKSLDLLKKIKEDTPFKKKIMVEFLLNFSQTYLMMENFSKAIEFCNDAMIYQESNFPEFHPYMKQCYVSMGNLNFLQGFYEKAVNNFEYALNINNKIFPPDHESFIDINYDLGTVYSKTEANPMVYLKLFEQALELFQKNPNIKKTPKEKKEQMSFIHSSIARTYYTLNKFEKAVEYFQKALNFDKELYPELDHLRIVEEYLLLGNSYSCLSNYETALKNCEEALNLAEKLLPETDEKMIDILFDLGDICNNLKKIEEGLIYYERIIKIYEKNKKLNDSKILEVFLAISSLYMSLGNIDQAIKALLSGQQKYKALKKNEYQDPMILNVLNSLGALYSSSATYDKSAKVYNDSLEISKKYFQNEEKYILDALVGLAISYFNNEQFEKSIKYFQEALELKEKKNEKGANVGDLCTNVGYAFKTLKNMEEAKKYFEKAVEYYQESLPINHKDLKTAIETLKSIS